VVQLHDKNDHNGVSGNTFLKLANDGRFTDQYLNSPDVGGDPEEARSTTRKRHRFEINTLMSSAQLQSHGLHLHRDQDANDWLIPLDADTLVKARPSAGWFSQLAGRVDELRVIAADEELPFCKASAEQALQFARGINASRRPSAFLVGNGNVRLLWTLGAEQIGLQFKDAGIVQYVMIAHRSGQIAQHMGTDDADVVRRQIAAVGLRHLLND
jgi:hypothetical protein